MPSVIKRILKIKQQTGYLHLLKMNMEILIDDRNLCESENLYPSIVDVLVDYLSRFI